MLPLSILRVPTMTASSVPEPCSGTRGYRTMTGVLEGVTRFPSEFAARYREKGYLQDRTLFDGLRDGLRRYADRVAIIDDSGLPYARIMREWDELGYEQSVMDLVFHANAERVLGI